MKFHILVTQEIPEIGINLLKKCCIVEVARQKGAMQKRELINKAKNKEIILSLLTDNIDHEVLDSCPFLKLISNYAVGFDNIDIATATKHGVLVTNTPDVLTETVAEHTIALLFASARRIVEADSFTRAGKYKGWDPFLFLGNDLKGKTLGIVGLGNIGSAVAQRVIQGLGMKVLYTKRNRDKDFEKKYKAHFASLSRLLKESDAVSLHVPLTPETHHLINKKTLALMKPEAILINTSRGSVVDEKSLVSLLHKQKNFRAALDVFECEPSLSCDAQTASKLKSLPNVILTPHIASATFQTRNAMAVLAAQQILDFISGKVPKNLVNKEILKIKRS